ncbi:MAG: glycosyltransferase [Candidatus Korobacteraceae bacterium]
MTPYAQHTGLESAEQVLSSDGDSKRAGQATHNFSPDAVRGRVLIVAYHFPPQAGSSGLLRSLKFCRYLPEFGWLPTVLTISPRAYERIDTSQMAEVPSFVEVIRAFGLDSRRHLSLAGRYLRPTALPDRWVTWLAGAIPAGLYTIRKQKIDAIFTTYPIASAVLIGYFLHILSGKPWIVDFRDSMTEEGYPEDPLTRRFYQWIERKAIQHGSRFIFTAPAAIRMYLARYPRLDPERCLLLPNGYDESDFASLIPPRPVPNKLRLLHSGLIYPWERDPSSFFRALARLKTEGQIRSETISIDLRACGAEARYQQQLGDLGIQDLVRLLPALPYRESLQDAAEADCLLLLQAACCDHQIPAKAYEYLRLNKPILALTTNAGDTAGLLREAGGATIVDLEDENAIYSSLPGFLRSVRDRSHPLPHASSIYSRRTQAGQLADCLSGVLVTTP